MSWATPVLLALPLALPVLVRCDQRQSDLHRLYDGTTAVQRAAAEAMEVVCGCLAAGARGGRLATADSWPLASSSRRRRRMSGVASSVVFVADDTSRSRPCRSHRRHTSRSARTACAWCARGHGRVCSRLHLSGARFSGLVVDDV